MPAWTAGRRKRDSHAATPWRDRLELRPRSDRGRTPARRALPGSAAAEAFPVAVAAVTSRARKRSPRRGVGAPRSATIASRPSGARQTSRSASEHQLAGARREPSGARARRLRCASGPVPPRATLPTHALPPRRAPLLVHGPDRHHAGVVLPPLASLRSAVSPLRGSARRLSFCQDHRRRASGARCARGGDTSRRDCVASLRRQRRELTSVGAGGRAMVFSGRGRARSGRRRGRSSVSRSEAPGGRA